MNLTPEQRLALAKFAGHESQLRPGDGQCVIRYPGTMLNVGWSLYAPDTNDSEAMELLIKLLDDGWLIWRARDLYVCHDNDGLEITGPTLNLAICHAVLALLEGEGE